MMLMIGVASAQRRYTGRRPAARARKSNLEFVCSIDCYMDCYVKESTGHEAPLALREFGTAARLICDLNAFIRFRFMYIFGYKW